MGPLFVGQIPSEPALFTIRDEDGEPVSLSGYTSAEFVLVTPARRRANTSAGSAEIVDAASGKVEYNWPSTTLFPSAGGYFYQIILRGPNGVADYTSAGELQVRKALGF